MARLHTDNEMHFSSGEPESSVTAFTPALCQTTGKSCEIFAACAAKDRRNGGAGSHCAGTRIAKVAHRRTRLKMAVPRLSLPLRSSSFVGERQILVPRASKIPNNSEPRTIKCVSVFECTFERIPTFENSELASHRSPWSKCVGVRIPRVACAR